MSKQSLDPLIINTLFESSCGDEVSNLHYRDLLLHTLKKILPADFFEWKESGDERFCHQKQILQQMVPLISCSETRKFPGPLSFFALTKHRPYSFKFFFEMVSRWLIPGRRLDVVLVYTTDFRFTCLCDEVYTLCEIVINIPNEIEFKEIQRHFPIIETEIALGIQSEFYAQRIMEIKGLSSDEKTALIQGFIAFLAKRFPNHYDNDIFTEMQHVLVTYRDEFKAARKARHLSRIISIQYLFRKALRDAIRKNMHRRHLSLKIFRSSIHTSMGPKRVLSIVVGVSFLRDQENFGERHLMKAIQYCLPSAIAIDHSFSIHKLGADNFCIAYIEIEKKEAPFTFAEMRKLRRDLPANLRSSIEHRLHDVFMPRNEEEIMRNIVTLTNQIKYVRDIPQVLITFDEQAYAHLYFTVILARLLKPDSPSITDLFKRESTIVEYLHDRTKVMGIVRKKYAKEATVFRLKLPKEGFLRADHNTIDLYKARLAIVKELSRIFGEIRDYNGGMILKQYELLSAIRQLLTDVTDYDELLLENFFYSLSPMIIRAVLDPSAFKILFLMLLEGIKEYKQEEKYYLKFYRQPYNIFTLIIIEDFLLKDRIHRAVQDLQIPSTELAYAYLKTHGYACMGYICCAHDANKKELFFEVISQVLASWEGFSSIKSI